MAVLSFTRVTDEPTADAWARVHTEVIPHDPLTVEQVLHRAEINILDLAYVDGTVVGCSTVRPASDDDPVTVIARIVPGCRRRGFGGALLAHALTHTRAMQAGRVQTIVLASNTDGLEFALRRGFVETERYTLDGDSVAYIHLDAALADLVHDS